MRLAKLILTAIVVTLSTAKGTAQYVQPMRYDHYSFTQQVNIGVGSARTTAASAYLEIGPATGATKGIIMPRVTTTLRDALVAPATGLVIYNTTTNRINYYNGSSWVDPTGSTYTFPYSVVAPGNAIQLENDTIPFANGLYTFNSAGRRTWQTKTDFLSGYVTQSTLDDTADAIRDDFPTGGGSWTGNYINILLSGQSNAWGASGPTANDTARNSRVLIWNHAQSTPAWVTATINQRPFRTSGYNAQDGGASRNDLNGSTNSTFYLAKKLAAENPYDTIRIVMAIGDGQPISTWATKYTDSILVRGAASGIDHVDLFIWDQGESDGATAEATYVAAFDTIKATLRRQTWFKQSTPIVVSGLPQAVYGTTPSLTYADTILQKMDYDADVWTGYANTDGLSLWSGGDNVHFSAGSLDTLGTLKYYQAWKALPYRHIEEDNSLDFIRFGELRFIVGATNAPANGDSVMSKNYFEGQHLRVWREGELLDTSATNGYEFSTTQLTFHPPLLTGEKVYIESSNTSHWQELPLVETYETITFPTNVQLINTSGVWTVSGGGAAYGYTGLSDLSLSGDGYVYMAFTSGDGNAAFGLNSVNAQTGYGGMEVGILINPGTGEINSIASGSIAATGVTLSTGNYARIKRSGQTFKLQKSTNNISWTDVYTFPYTGLTEMFIVTDIYGSGGTLRLPKGYKIY